MNTEEAFRHLEEEYRGLIGEVPPAVKQNLDGTIRLFGLVSGLVELFVPQMFESISDMLSNNNSDINADI